MNTSRTRVRRTPCKRAWLLASVLLSLNLMSGSAYADRAISIEAHVTDELGSGSHLVIELRNTGSEAISFFAGNLPWSRVIFDGFQLFAVPMNIKNSPLHRMYSLRNPVGKVEVLPNKQLSGSIDLNKEFPDLQQARKKSDVAIFWSYSLVAVDNQQLQPIAAALILKRLQNGD